MLNLLNPTLSTTGDFIPSIPPNQRFVIEKTSGSVLIRSAQRAHLAVTTTVDGTAGPHDLIVVEQGTGNFSGEFLDRLVVENQRGRFYSDAGSAVSLSFRRSAGGSTNTDVATAKVTLSGYLVPLP